MTDKMFQMNPKPMQLSFCEVLSLLGSFETGADRQMLSDTSDMIQKMHRDPRFKETVAANPALRKRFVELFRTVHTAAVSIDADYQKFLAENLEATK